MIADSPFPPFASFRRLALFAFALACGVLLLPVSGVTVTTTNGAGADRAVVECNYTINAGTTNGTLDGSSGGADTQINARWVSVSPFTNQVNEVIALRFDLTGYSLPACTNFQIQLFNHRTNSARILHYYGVVNGAGGANNNGTVTNWTDDNWSESSSVLKFSTMPGLHYDGSSATKGFSNTVDLGSATMNAVNEGVAVTFSSAALESFIQAHPNSVLTILVGTDTSSTGQSRFCSKETTATALNVITGTAGILAPRLSFSVAEPAATGIAFVQQPTDASAGAAISPAVTVMATNALGAPVTNALVTLSLLSGTGSLNGTLSQSTDASGIATFTDLNLNLAGTKQLLAGAGSLTATSVSFTISAGPAAALAFTTQPSDVALKKVITPPVVVQLRDAYGNNVASNGLPIALALTTGTGSLSGSTNIATDATGKSTFTNLSLSALGTKVLTASKTGLPSMASVSFQVTNALAAFPGAEGAGVGAVGGRGGDVYYVTSLSDANTSGTLRYGINNAPAGGRTILFKVSGNIALNSTLTINKPRITVAGQTAPGDGICIQNYSFNIAANDVILRHMRTRLGTNALQEADAMWINSGTNIIVDHVSASWSVDEVLSSSREIANLTVQNCFITESLQNSIHVKGAHGYGGIISSSFSTTYSYLRNLYAHNDSRNPRLGSDSQSGILRLDFRNNVIYNWGFRAGYSGDTNETTELNYVGNYLVAGPSSTYNYAFLSGGNTTTIYQSGNFIDTDKDGLVDGANTGWGMFAGPMTQLASPLEVPEINTDPAGTAYQRVLAQSGAMPWRRDAYDQRMVRSVRTQTGKIIDFVNSTPFAGDYITNNIGGTNYIGVNPWPTLAAEAAPVDTDNDGMPNFWETALGLATNNAADRNLTNELGYTRLEDYLNWLAEPHALCDRNGYVDFNLRTANGGATNLTFVLANGTNGTVTLLGDGYTARFTATNNYSGLANFAYTATDPANGLSFGPANVGVLVTTTNAPNTPPLLAPITDKILTAGTTLLFTNSASDADVPAQTLTFSLLNAPTNASLTTNSGIFSWRPTVAQGGTTNAMQVVVADSGSPSLSATQAFSVIVNQPATPVMQSAASSNGQFTFVINGTAGPDYLVQSSTNLSQWTDVTNLASPAVPFLWTDPNAGNVRQQFYRIRLGP